MHALPKFQTAGEGCEVLQYVTFPWQRTDVFRTCRPRLSLLSGGAWQSVLQQVGAFAWALLQRFGWDQQAWSLGERNRGHDNSMNGEMYMLGHESSRIGVMRKRRATKRDAAPAQVEHLIELERCSITTVLFSRQAGASGAVIHKMRAGTAHRALNHVLKQSLLELAPKALRSQSQMTFSARVST